MGVPVTRDAKARVAAAHIALGHFEALKSFDAFLRLKDGKASLDRDRLSKDDLEGLQCLEMQADWLALATLLAWACSDIAPHSYPFILQSEMREIDPYASKTGFLDPASPFDRARIMLMSAVGALLLLELCAFRQPNAIPDHPSPASRILNLMLGAHSLVEALGAEPEAGWTPDRIGELVSAAGADINVMAGVMNVPTPIYSCLDSCDQEVSLLRDVRAILEGRTPTGEAGQSYVAMVSRSQKFDLDPSRALERARDEADRSGNE